MDKKYTIEVPIYSAPIRKLCQINQLKNIRIILYGGVPDSPLNGGRFNYTLDGFFLWDRLFFRLNKKQRTKATTTFYKTVLEANQSGIPFLIAYTNMFVDPHELTEENLFPVHWLAESSRKHGVRNGLILNNMLLESHIREQYQDRLIYVSSCTKYVLLDKVLTPSETMNMYREDILRYDLVTLTPQDSRREDVLKKAASLDEKKIIAICNSYCSYQCNSYHHYAYMSMENKKSLLAINDWKIFLKAFAFMSRQAHHCPALLQSFRKTDIARTVNMQLKAGIVNFKLGRGFGSGAIDQVIRSVVDFENNKAEKG